jgi:hypothetical protein
MMVAMRLPSWHIAQHGHLQTMRGNRSALENRMRCLCGSANLRREKDDGKDD